MAKVIARPLLHSVMNRAAEHLIPLQVTLELTHRCNLSCKHCYVDTPAQDNELSFAELRDILNQLADAGCMYLLFTGGECLSRSDFFDVVSYAKERGFNFMFLTNGTLVTPEIARKIAALAPVFVGMSLHGATPGTHDGITRKSGSFTSSMRAIELLKDLDVPISLQTLLMDSNVHEAESMKNLAQRLGVYLRFGYEILPTRNGSLNPFQYQAGLDKLCHYFTPERVEDGKFASEVKAVCKAGRGICSISPTGDVTPCLLMPLIVGNLRQATFAEIWRVNPSPELKYLRSLTWDDLSDCKNCSLAKYCKKCVGVAFSETGALTRPAPSACRNAALRSEFFKQRGVIL
jgi:radical SAM protein with 4Fe4S-binding SPASM domain